MKRKGRRGSKKTVLVEKYFCPVCGSTRIEKSGKALMCTNCRSLFAKPGRAIVNLRKRPRYIG